MNRITAGSRPFADFFSPSLSLPLHSGPLSCKTPTVPLWFSLSLVVPLYFGLISLIHATTSGPIIQDDARLHIVWLQRLIDPDLFPADIMANYYFAIQSVGFKALYSAAAALGIPPLFLAKILPLGLALITTIYLFWTTLLILPVPISGFLTTLVLNQNVWLKDDLISATPRAFVYPIFAAFLYYLLRGSTVRLLVTLVLQGMFYPQMMVVSVGMLTLRLFSFSFFSVVKRLIRRPYKRLNPRSTNEHSIASDKPRIKSVLLWLIALGLTSGLLVFFSRDVAAQVGPLLNAEEMRAMPEFQLNGRREYFGVSPLQFIFSGASGLRFPLFPPIICLGALLLLIDSPFVSLPVLRKRWRFVNDSPLVCHITPHARVLGQLILAAVGLFFLAHLTFPSFYLPSRYTFYSTRFVMAIASGLVLTLIIERSWHWIQGRRQGLQPWTTVDRLKAALGGGMAIAILVVPAIPAIFLPCQGWVIGQAPALYEELSQFPKDILVASLTSETNNIPAFAQRSVLVGEEFALPYHPNFYDTITERMAALVEAQYSPSPATIRSFIQTYGIDLWIVDPAFAMSDYLAQQPWLVNSMIRHTVTDQIEHLEQGIKPALVDLIPSCSISMDRQNKMKTPLILLDAQCLLRKRIESKSLLTSVHYVN